MTFHLFIAAFVGAAVTLVALVSLTKGPLNLFPLIQGLGLGRVAVIAFNPNIQNSNIFK